MPENQRSKKSSVTLEQLLHLKRAERPEPAFWDEFDRELHRRQLATVVNARPWYSRALHVAMVGLRRSAPFGAAAGALAAGFMVFDQQRDTAATAQVAQASPENTLVVLPAETFSPHVFPVAHEAVPGASASRELSQPQFVVHQFELPPSPSRPWKTVASPNVLTVSSTGMGDGFESAGWTAGPALRAPMSPGAGSF